MLYHWYELGHAAVRPARVAAASGGRYISHLRSEGNRLLEGIDELIEISRRAGIPAEVYHLKAAGRPNWGKLDAALARIEKARADGLAVSADNRSGLLNANDTADLLTPASRAIRAMPATAHTLPGTYLPRLERSQIRVASTGWSCWPGPT